MTKLSFSKNIHKNVSTSLLSPKPTVVLSNAATHAVATYAVAAYNGGTYKGATHAAIYVIAAVIDL